MEEAMTESAGYLLENLTIGEPVVLDAQYLGHQNNGGSKGVLAIKRLCYNVCRALNSDAWWFYGQSDWCSNGRV